jgi:hypothetical protein
MTRIQKLRGMAVAPNRIASVVAVELDDEMETESPSAPSRIWMSSGSCCNFNLRDYVAK